MPEIKHVCPQTRAPRDGDPGECAIGWYFVTDGVLKMCDEDGRPTGKSYKLALDDNAYVIASRLTLEKWRKTADVSDFNRPFLNYQKIGVA